MESITLKMLELELENYKKMDLEKKIDITANIYERMRATTTQEPSNVDSCPTDKVSSLTGVNIDILKQIRKLEDVSRKFKDWENEEEVSASMNILYNKMKKHLQDCYTNDRKIPTKSGLLAGFRKRFSPQFYALLNKYFTTIQVPGTPHSIIVEKPEIVLNRQKYLRKKIELVRDYKVFVYIEDICFYGNQRTSFKMGKPKTANTKRLVLAASPELGFLSSIFCCRTIECSLSNWLEQVVIPILPPGCVLVVENSMFGDVPCPPKSHSTKKKMVDWLAKKDIPHNPKSHRAELYALIEIYKKTCSKITKLDEILQLHGHAALCREEGVVFEYFEPFWRKLKELLDMRKGTKNMPKLPTCKIQIPVIAKKLASMIEKEYWQELQKKLFDIEMNTYRKDKDMEEIIDKLMVYAASEQFDPGETEFDDYCEAMRQEYIFS